MILIIDDDSAIRSSLSFMLKRAKYEVETASGPKEAIEIIRRTAPQLILMDMNFTLSTSGEEGLTLLRQTRIFRPDVPVILMTAWGSIRLAVQGMQAGAFDFITKPWNNAALMQRIETALELTAPQKETPGSADQKHAGFDRHRIIGKSRALNEVLDTLCRIAPTNAPVLITGESGTGKELIAEALHVNSRRASGPFVKVNLGGISQSLFESEMFGHRKGAFTDAVTDRIGRFEMADRGTIFLDEIGEIPLDLQGRLLRVLQEHEILRIGGDKVQKIDIRVISATNMDLYSKVQEGKFRADLYYRLNVMSLTIAPLRMRSDDILLLLDYFLEKYGSAVRSEFLPPEVTKYLTAQTYPGNIRELENLAQRIEAFKEGETSLSMEEIMEIGDAPICRSDDAKGQANSESTGIGETLPADSLVVQLDSLDRIENQVIQHAMNYYGGNKTEVMNTLQISRTTLWKKLKEIEIEEESE